jgi:hypothetical protein
VSDLKNNVLLADKHDTHKNRPQVVEHWLKGEINMYIAVEFHLSGLIGTVSQPDMQKIRKIGFFFENMLRWQFEVENNSDKWLFSLHIYLRTNKILIHNSFHVFDNGGGGGGGVSHENVVQLQ